MTAAIGEAVGRGAKAVICASTGNTAASAAAYAARAGLRCTVLIPQGKVAAGKHIDRAVAGQACVQFIFNIEGFQALSDRVRYFGNIDTERSSGVVRPCLWVPDPAGKTAKFRPVLKRTTTEMNYKHTFAILHKLAEIGPRLRPGSGFLPVHEMQNYNIVSVQGR
jgi:hypothetical protein